MMAVVYADTMPTFDAAAFAPRQLRQPLRCYALRHATYYAPRLFFQPRHYAASSLMFYAMIPPDYFRRLITTRFAATLMHL